MYAKHVFWKQTFHDFTYVCVCVCVCVYGPTVEISGLPVLYLRNPSS